MTDPARHTVRCRQSAVSSCGIWIGRNLYSVHVRLLVDGKVVDEESRRIGFREAVFTDQGFSLNGKIVKLRGLDRHQTFPFVGQAMPGRVQRKDAEILRKGVHCNIVRTSHYPQSRHFLDAAMSMGCWCWRRFPGGSTLGLSPGSRSLSTMLGG